MKDNIKKRINIGDEHESWCSVCGRKTPHIFGYFMKHWLTCEVCFPEAKEIILAKCMI
jgi:hypothetical protein